MVFIFCSAIVFFVPVLSCEPKSKSLVQIVSEFEPITYNPVYDSKNQEIGIAVERILVLFVPIGTADLGVSFLLGRVPP